MQRPKGSESDECNIVEIRTIFYTHQNHTNKYLRYVCVHCDAANFVFDFDSNHVHMVIQCVLRVYMRPMESIFYAYTINN